MKTTGNRSFGAWEDVFGSRIIATTMFCCLLHWYLCTVILTACDVASETRVELK